MLQIVYATPKRCYKLPCSKELSDIKGGMCIEIMGLGGWTQPDRLQPNLWELVTNLTIPTFHPEHLFLFPVPQSCNKFHLPQKSSALVRIHHSGNPTIVEEVYELMGTDNGRPIIFFTSSLCVPAWWLPRHWQNILWDLQPNCINQWRNSKRGNKYRKPK